MPGIGDEGQTVTCTEARALITDALTRELQPTEARTLRDHLAQCESCRVENEELATLWKDLGDLPVPGVRPDARARFAHALAGAAAAEPPNGRGALRGKLGYWTAIAAGLVIVAALGGYRAGAATHRNEGVERDIASAGAGQTYLLLLRVRETPRAVSRPADEARIVAEYARWASALRDEGKLVIAEKLADSPAQLLGAGSSSPESDRVGGFFLIRAASFEEAQRIANDCPHLRHGGRVELRAIEPT